MLPSLSIFPAPCRNRGDAGQRLVGDDDRQAGFFHQQAVEVAQQGATAGQDHALSAMSAPSSGGFFQRRLDRETIWLSGSVRASRFRWKKSVNLAGCLGLVDAGDFHFLDLGAREGGADGLLDVFGGVSPIIMP